MFSKSGGDLPPRSAQRLSTGRIGLLAGALLLIVGAFALALAPGRSGTGSGLVPSSTLSVRNSAESLAPSKPGSLVLEPASPSNDSRPMLKGSPGSGSMVTVYKNGDCTGTNHKEYTASQFQNGVEKKAHVNGSTTFSAVSHEGSDVSACSDPITYVEDEIAPVVTLLPPGNGSTTSDSTPLFGGTGGTGPRDAANVTVNVYAGTTASGSPQEVVNATRDTGTGNYAVDASPALPDGTYTAQASQADQAGNTGQSPAQTFKIVTGHPAPAISITAPADGSVFVQGAHVKAAYGCTDPGGPGLASCAGPVASGAQIDTSGIGPHPFSVTAADTAGSEATRTAHYRVLSPGTITLTGPAKTFSRKGRLWVDTGFVASCPELGPDCVGIVTAHRSGALTPAALKSGRFGHSHLRIRGAKAIKLVFKLGKSRARELTRRKRIRLRFDVRLSRGTTVLATAKRTVNLSR